MRAARKWDPRHRHNLSWVKEGTDDDRRVAQQAYHDEAKFDDRRRLTDEAILDYVEEYEDGIDTTICSVFPNAVFQQFRNSLATRQIRPKSENDFELYWTILGYADDDAAMHQRRMAQANMVGPAGVRVDGGCRGCRDRPSCDPARKRRCVGGRGRRARPDRGHRKSVIMHRRAVPRVLVVLCRTDGHGGRRRHPLGSLDTATKIVSAQVALVIGAGDATGGAIARRFAAEGFTVCVTRRQCRPRTYFLRLPFLIALHFHDPLPLSGKAQAFFLRVFHKPPSGRFFFAC